MDLFDGPKEEVEDLAAATPVIDLAAATPVIALGDRLSSLPSDILPQILSFLPAHEAQRTCVLARTWRNLWKEKRIFPRRLLITATAADPAVQQDDVRGFVDRLLDLRLREIKDAPLESCEIRFRWFYDEKIPSLSRWIRRALECHIQVLRVRMWRESYQYLGYPYVGYDFLTGGKPLASQNLTRLALTRIVFDEKVGVGGKPDFSSCPALEDLELDDCLFLAPAVVVSPSLKRLTVRRSQFIGRCSIRVPRLVSLCLEALTATVPQLESMPKLVLAYVNIGQDSSDDDGTDDDSDSGDDVEADIENCVLLGGLSEARNLTLISEDNTSVQHVIRGDLRWCPTFHKLKTLLLNDHWCKPVDCTPLACILEHAPVLEKLTIEFSQQVKCNYKVEMKGHRHATEEPTMVSQHLKIIKVKCETVNETVLNLLNFMGTLNIVFQFSVRKGSK